MVPLIKHLGLVEYQQTWQAMKQFTGARNADTRDEIWLLHHFPVYTQGLAGKPEHLLHASDIPVVKIDRGGQITYHGPGQVVAYLMLDLRHWKLNVRGLVRLMEQAVVDLLAPFGVIAQGREEAPGVYVDGARLDRNDDRRWTRLAAVIGRSDDGIDSCGPGHRLAAHDRHRGGRRGGRLRCDQPVLQLCLQSPSAACCLCVDLLVGWRGRPVRRHGFRMAGGPHGRFWSVAWRRRARGQPLQRRGDRRLDFLVAPCVLAHACPPADARLDL